MHVAIKLSLYLCGAITNSAHLYSQTSLSYIHVSSKNGGNV